MRESLSVRIDADNRNHHIWLNGKTWWIHFTAVREDGRQRRVRYSLETDDVAKARLLRDAIFAAWDDPEGPGGPAEAPDSAAEAPEGAVEAPESAANTPGAAAETGTTPRSGVPGLPLSGSIQLNDFHGEGLEVFGPAPHTALSPRLAQVDHGPHALGLLHSDYYLHGDAELNEVVLWMGDNPTQHDDDIPLLIPVATAQWNACPRDEDDDIDWRTTAAQLLHAWWSSGVSRETGNPCIVTGGEVLGDDSVRYVFGRAQEGRPLDLSRLG